METSLYSPPPSGAQPIPGELKKMGQAHWTYDRSPMQVVVALANRDLVWNTPIFDLRPEYAETDPTTVIAIPINRSPALGGSTYLRLVITDSPAFFGDSYWYVRFRGGDHRSDQLADLTPEYNITTAVRSGGTAAVGPPATLGGSGLSFEVPASGIRFWQVFIRARQTGTARVYQISGAVM